MYHITCESDCQRWYLARDMAWHILMGVTPIRLRLREIREARGLSQRELARRAKVTQSTISLIERGISKGVDFVTLEKLASALEVDPALLIVQDSVPGRPRRG